MSGRRDVSDADIVSDRTQSRDGEGAANPAPFRGGMARSGLPAPCPSAGGRSRAIPPWSSARSKRVPARDCADEERDRQPQASRSAFDIRRTVKAETPTASRAPTSLAAAASEAISPRRSPGAFQQVGDDAGILAAHREPHHAAEQDSSQAASGPICAWVGSKPVSQHRHRHHRHRQQQHGPPALAVADVAEEDRPDRPHQISDGKSAERRHERRRAPRRRRRATAPLRSKVEREVVPFDDGGEGGDSDRLARHDTQRRRVRHLRPKPKQARPSTRNKSAMGPIRRAGGHVEWQVMESKAWWARQGLNLRPPRCEHGALPLSYAPTPSCRSVWRPRTRQMGPSGPAVNSGAVDARARPRR